MPAKQLKTSTLAKAPVTVSPETASDIDKTLIAVGVLTTELRS